MTSCIIVRLELPPATTWSGSTQSSSANISRSSAQPARARRSCARRPRRASLTPSSAGASRSSARSSCAPHGLPRVRSSFSPRAFSARVGLRAAPARKPARSSAERVGEGGAVGGRRGLGCSTALIVGSRVRMPGAGSRTGSRAGVAGRPRSSRCGVSVPYDSSLGRARWPDADGMSSPPRTPTRPRCSVGQWLNW